MPYSLAWMEDDLIDPSLLRRLKSAQAKRPADTVARLLNPEREAGAASVESKPASGDASAASLGTQAPGSATTAPGPVDPRTRALAAPKRCPPK